MPLRWCSLETIKFRRFSLKTDIWAFGVLIHEVFSNAGLPYPAIRNRDLPDKLESGYRLPPVGMCPLKVYVLMLKCWDEDPSRRPSAEAIEQEIFECARFSKDERVRQLRHHFWTVFARFSARPHPHMRCVRRSTLFYFAPMLIGC